MIWGKINNDRNVYFWEKLFGDRNTFVMNLGIDKWGNVVRPRLPTM